MAQLKITQVRGLVGTRQNQRDTMRTLGLRKIRQSVTRPDDSNVRGMIKTVSHLVSVEEVD
ncbi:50S ribosomal protein L30 [Saccharopolyspora halophila]|uniref:Large ribosomal subunit protein uL30 n=1 Tax=Saccharopolyspora halophila TaxID=405551 RepID=A0ABN3FHL7_9PSEU